MGVPGSCPSPGFVGASAALRALSVAGQGGYQLFSGTESPCSLSNLPGNTLADDCFVHMDTFFFFFFLQRVQKPLASLLCMTQSLPLPYPGILADVEGAPLRVWGSLLFVPL